VTDTDDRAVLRLKAKRKQRLKGRRVAVKVQVSSPEALQVKLRGVISGRGLKRVKLKPRTATLVPGSPLVLKLKPSKRRAAKTIARRLASGGKAKAKLKASGRDDLGNVAKASAKVKLKAKRHR
jgi:hypothetical protein